MMYSYSSSSKVQVQVQVQVSVGRSVVTRAPYLWGRYPTYKISTLDRTHTQTSSFSSPRRARLNHSNCTAARGRK